MDINVNKAGYPTDNNVQSSQTNTAGKSTTNVPVGQSKENEQLKELYKKLCVTKEQFEKLCKDCPGFETLSFEKQLEIVNAKFGTERAARAEGSTGANQAASNAEDVNKSSDTGHPAEDKPFNHKEFSKLSKEEKEKVLTLELAKNIFLYSDSSNPKSIEDWNALSPEEQKKFLDTANKQLNNLTGEFSKLAELDAKGNGFEFLMSIVQASNENHLSFETFLDGLKNGDTRFKSLHHDYIFNQDEENLSDGQKAYLEAQEFISKAIAHAKNEQFQTILTPDEMSAQLKELGKTKEQVELDYLNSKQDKLTSQEQKRKEKLEKFVKRNEMLIDIAEERAKDPSKQVDYGVMKGLQDSKFGEAYNAAQTPEQKLNVLTAYSKAATEGLSKEQKAKFYSQLMDELLNDPANMEMLNTFFKLHEMFKGSFAGMKDGIMPEMNAANIEMYEDNPEYLNAVVKAQNEIQKEDKARAERLKLKTTDNATNAQMAILAEDYAGDESLNVQRGVKERALAVPEGETPYQQAMIEAIVEHSSTDVVAETAARADELNSDYQLEGLQILTQHSEHATAAANEAGVITRFDKENQTAAFNYMKEHLEDIFGDDKDKAIEQLNILSDQIKDLDKDNQLEAHTTMMSSKYSEVQTHTAGNIGSYDPDVQSAAMDVVYASGNAEAINAASEVIHKLSSPTVQQTEIVRFAAEMALSNETAAAELEEVLGSGKLTTRELRELTPAQRREYFTKLFESAPPAKKIEMLMKFAELSGLANKRLIYTLIARTTMLTGVVEQGMGETMLSVGLPVDAVNKIITVMKRSTSFQVKDQLANLKQDSGFSQYFSKDELEEAKADKNGVQTSGGSQYAGNDGFENIKAEKGIQRDIKMAYTPAIDPQTRKKLEENDSTMYLNA